MMRNGITTLSALLLCACATTSPDKIQLQKGEGKSAIVLNLASNSYGYLGVSDLQILAYDKKKAEEKPNTAPTRLGLASEILNFRKTKDGYAVTKIKPGDYYVGLAAVQTRWGACFNRETVKFTVAPDTVTYLGSIDFTPIVLEVGKRAKAAGEEKIRVAGGQFGPAIYYGDLTNKPDFKFKSDASDLRKVSEYLKSKGMQFDVNVVPAEYSSISFNRVGDGNPFTSDKACAL